MIPRVRRLKSKPFILEGRPAQRPFFTKAAFSIMRRLAVAINVKASSATVSFNTPGVLPYGIPAAVSSSIFTLSYPTEACAITFKLGAALTRSASTDIELIDHNPSASRNHSFKTSLGIFVFSVH